MRSEASLLNDKRRSKLLHCLAAMINKSVTMLAADVITPAGHEYESREQPRNREHRDQPGKGGHKKDYK